ncbi:MAG TPA: c-type cytochrome [Planctomycetota bacterium]|nr:c-type cytochrome [Planctomycetota bacterium]
MAETPKVELKAPPAVLPQQAQAQKNVGRSKRTPDDQAEYFYNQKNMHRLMFFSSFFLLFSLVLMFVDDYWGVTPAKNRHWKEYQSTFSSMELTKLQFEIAEVRGELKKHADRQAQIDLKIAREDEKLENPDTEMEIQILVLDPTTGVKEKKQEKVKPAELARERLALLGEYQLKMQVMNFDKSEFMTRRFQYEEADHHLQKARQDGDPRLKTLEKHYEHALERWNEIQEKTRKSKAAFDEVDKKMSLIDDRILGAKAALTALKAEKTKILKDRDDLMLRLNREKPQIANAIRNAPMLDFFDPSIKIQQQIVPTVLEDLNFAKVEKIDRCHTCHRGIDNPNYEAEHFPDREQEEDRWVFTNENLRKFVAHARGKAAPETCDVCVSEKDGMIVTTKHGAWGSDEVVKYTKTLMAHPRLELFAGPGSPHALDKVGCTSCHEGDGRDTEFSRVVHMPDTPAQRKDWERRHHYHYRHLWDAPMLPKRHVYASCRKCHSAEVEVSGGDDPMRGTAMQQREVGLPAGDDYVKGMQIYERSGCYACHRTDTYLVLPKDTDQKLNPKLDPNRRFRRPGPPLTHIKDKVDPDWAVRWVMSPKSFRISTRMPHFFGQSNARTLKVNGADVGPERFERIQAGAMIKFFFEASSTRNYQPIPAPPQPGDAKRGLALFEQVGCRACHTYTPDSEYAKRKDLRNPDDEWRAPTGESWILKEFGPNLSGIASKFGSDTERARTWIYNWVKNPKHYFKDSRMGAFPLVEQDLHDVTAWLLTLKKEGDFDKRPGMPAFDDADHKILDALIYEQLRSKMPDVDATSALAAMQSKKAEKVLWFGRRMVQNYGCFSCHEMNREVDDDPLTPAKEEDPLLKRLPLQELAVDWPNTEGIGVELTGSQPEGNKAVDQLAFGYTHYDGVKHHGVHFEHPIFKKPYRHVDPENTSPEVVKIQDFRHVWIRNKLLDPRVFDGGKLGSLPPDELLKMPNFYLNAEEVRLLTTFVLSFTNHDIPLNLVGRAKKVLSEDEVSINRGLRLIRENNCRACHRFSLDKLELEYEREETTSAGKKTFKSYEWVEGAQSGIIDDEMAASLMARWGLPPSTPERPAQLYSFSWCSDGCTMQVNPAINTGARFVRVEGSKAEYIDVRQVEGKEVVTRRPVRRWKPMEGGDILAHIKKYKTDHVEDWKDSDDNELLNLEDPSVIPSRYPPMLRTQGVKTQQQWLFEFLKDPAAHPIRPALHPIVPGGKGPPDPNIRMPNFNFNDEQAAALVRYFWARDRLASEETHPFTSFPERDPAHLAGREAELKKAEQVLAVSCGLCHYWNGNAPTGGPADSFKFAPEIAGVEQRLRPRWLYPWLASPALVYPGTPMTSADYKELGGGTDQEKGLRAAVDLMMNFKKYAPPFGTKPAPAPPPQEEPKKDK